MYRIKISEKLIINWTVEKTVFISIISHQINNTIRNNKKNEIYN
jgi:hypothetical protein